MKNMYNQKSILIKEIQKRTSNNNIFKVAIEQKQYGEIRPYRIVGEINGWEFLTSWLFGEKESAEEFKNELKALI